MTVLKKLLVAIAVGCAAAAFNYLYTYIDDGHRGLLMFFCLTTVLSFAIKRRGV